MKYVSNYDFYLDLKERLKKDIDVIISENKELKITIFFQEQMCNIASFNHEYLPILFQYQDLDPTQSLTGIVRDVDIEKVDVYQIIFNGLLLMYDEKRDKFYLFDISQTLRRPTGDSNVESQNIIGSRDGFTENYKDNVSLFRTRLKNSNFLIEEFKIGKRSKTWVGLLYIKDIHDEEKKAEIISLLNEVNIDALLTVNDLLPYLSKRHIFPVCNYIGYPDIAVSKLLDGEFIIVIDRIPVVLSLPTSLMEIVEERVDYLENKSSRIVQRLIVLICLFFSTVFLGIFVSILTFQIDILSLPLLSTFSVTQKGAIFPIFLEVLFVLFLFELYHFVGFRSSEKTLTSTLVLIGGIIIGQNLIESGLVGVLVITITAACYLSSFVVTNNIHFIFGISIVRLLYILAALFFGIYGVGLMLIVLTTYFSKQSFLGVHLFHPFVPFDVNGFKNFFRARADKRRNTRDLALGVKDKTSKGAEYD